MEDNLYYLRKMPDGTVECYIDRRTMQTQGDVYHATCTPEEWKAAGCFARIVDGEIVLGKDPDVKREEIAEYFRKARYSRLRECDKMSPMRWYSMTPEQQQAWENYRQELLDLPQRPGFPWDGPDTYTDWPVKPE